MGSCVEPHYLITTECMAITSAMRKSSRWVDAGIAAILGAPLDTRPEDMLPSSTTIKSGLTLHGMARDPEEATSKPESLNSEESHSGSLSSPETSLILGFASIRPELGLHGTKGLNTVKLVRPFLEVIKSPLVSGHITSLALTSIEHFFVLGLLRQDSTNILKCLDETVHALTHCRFEATDRQEDDAVLLQLMSLMDKVICSHCGKLLSEKAVSEIVDTCLSMVRQMKRRDSLRFSVVSTLLSLVRVVFSSRDGALPSAANSTFTTLVKILDPADLQHANGMRITVLSILKLCFEVCGKPITESPALDEEMQLLWKYLAQLVRITTSPRLVREALQLIITIQSVAPQNYKVHFEFTLVYLLTSLTPLSDLPRDESTDDMFYAGVPNRAKCVKSAPVEPGSNILAIPTAALQKTPEIREVMVEALAVLAVSSPSLFADLFINFDCDRASPDLCEDIVGFLCRNAYPDSATWSTACVPPLCLEAVLSGISSWAEITDSKPADDTLLRRLSIKGGKALESSVAETFNKSPSKGIADMIEHNLVKSSDPEDIAHFLHTCKRINKAVLGKYFAKLENKEVLEHYVNSFDFTGMRIDEALRSLLCSFRLPGESAQIENLLQKFADHYMKSGEKVEKDSDSAFILAYAVLMLNTDHYSPTLKRRMDYESFKRNVQGVDKNIPNEYVQAIFDGITSQEIIMPEEHDTDETFELSWRESVLSQQPASEYQAHNDHAEIVKAIFDITWRPIVSTLSFVFATATDDLVFRRVISGFHQLAILATRYKSQQALTHIIASLSQISALASGDLAFPNSNIEIRIEEHTSVIVSDLSTQFGGDLKAQMASITLFRVLNLASPELSRKAYTLIAKALTNIHLYGLGTPSAINIKPLLPIHTFERSKAGKPVGILSALSSYLTSSADTPPEPSDENVDAALGATECIKTCNIDTTVARLIEGSAVNFVEGALDVIPVRHKVSTDLKSTSPTSKVESLSETRYVPAQQYLLKLAGHAAENFPELKRKVCAKAAELGLIATALSIASQEEVPSLLDGLESVEGEVLAAIIMLKPGPSVWRALDLVEKPDREVHSYILRNAEEVDERSLPLVLSCIEKTSHLDSQDSIEALKKLAARFRNTEQYASILAVLGSFCGSASDSIRESSLSEVQRELLRDDQSLSWSEAANNVITPHILEKLLKPGVWKRAPAGMDITRQQAAAIVGKVFLHLTVSLDKIETEADLDAWVAVLRILDRLLSSRKQPALQESVEEMLKNVILVTEVAARGSPQFWDRTQVELKGFLPQVAELVNKKPEAPNSAAPASTTESDAETSSKIEPCENAIKT